MDILINVRSGVITGIIEAVILLFFVPIITRGTASIYNLLTTRRVFSGKLVRIYDNSLSVEDLIPRAIQVIRTAWAARRKGPLLKEKTDDGISRQCISLAISLVMSCGIIIISVFTDGKTIPSYETRELFLWNGGEFVDTTPSGQDSKAGDVLGMAGVRSACVERISTDEFNLFAVGFFEKQNFETGRSANNSVCLNGLQTREKIGISLKTNRIFIPSSDPVLKEDMEGEPANFTFLEAIDRTGTPDYCRVLVNTQGKSEEWTFSSEEYIGLTRFATQATRDENKEITLRGGVAFHYLDSPEADTVDSQECTSLTTTMFAGNRFTATITELGVTLDLRQLELVVADMLESIAITGYGRLESQEIMLRSYYAGAADSDENVGQPLGTFVPQQVGIHTGERQVTEMSTAAVVGLILTVTGTLVLLAATVGLRPQVKITSVSYVSRLYSGDRITEEPSNEGTGKVEYIGMEVDSEGYRYASPVPVYSRSGGSSVDLS